MCAVRWSLQRQPRPTSWWAAVHTGPAGFILSERPSPENHVPLASVFAVLVYVMLHTAIGPVLPGDGFWHSRTGIISFHSSLDLAIGRLWQDYTAIIGLVGLACPFALERLGQTGGLEAAPSRLLQYYRDSSAGRSRS